jgi:hypothetical protein
MILVLFGGLLLIMLLAKLAPLIGSQNLLFAIIAFLFVLCAFVIYRYGRSGFVVVLFMLSFLIGWSFGLNGGALASQGVNLTAFILGSIGMVLAIYLAIRWHVRLPKTPMSKEVNPNQK